MIRAALITAGLIVGWVAFVGACTAGFLLADAWVDRRYRRAPNGAHVPADDDTAEWLWESPPWLRLPGDEEETA